MKLGVCMLWTEMRKAEIPFSADLMLGLPPQVMRVTPSATRPTKLVLPSKPGPAKRRPKRATALQIAAR